MLPHTESHRHGGEHRQRLHALDRLLCECEALWRPQPYKEARPLWCASYPQLTAALLSLSDAALGQLLASPQALHRFLLPHLPPLAALERLTRLPLAGATVLRELGPHFHAGVPGRKWAQIAAFAAALGEPAAPPLEWCGGKGHLGRLLGAQWGGRVTTLEYDEALCDEGGVLARRSGTAQQFLRLDALGSEAKEHIGGHHPLALHACGELHRTLARHAIAAGVAALDIAPCCYFHGVAKGYHPFTAGLKLQLGRDELRLAVTETVTAVAREVALRDREMAWKLGFDLLRRDSAGESDYRPVRPIDKGWLRRDFAGFCRALAEREGVTLSGEIDWGRYEAGGWQRQRETMRLNLVRSAFRRGLELWLVLDLACHLERHGYRVSIATFCERSLTPRNILISARRCD